MMFVYNEYLKKIVVYKTVSELLKYIKKYNIKFSINNEFNSIEFYYHSEIPKFIKNKIKDLIPISLSYKFIVDINKWLFL